jgi:hypothetical protein
MSIRPEERAVRDKERVEEREGNIGRLWLNCDRKKWMAVEELEGAEHKLSLWESLEVEKG